MVGYKNIEENFYGRSKINSAFLINITLENLWSKVFLAQSKSDLNFWNKHLDSLWIILGGDEPTSSEWVKKYTEIELKIGKTGSLNHLKLGFNKFSSRELEIISVQYRLLLEKSLFLRRLENKQGKGTAYKDEDEDAM
jgi:hypothetical protein